MHSRLGQASSGQRLTDSIETALRPADGILVLDFVDRDEHVIRWSELSARSGGIPPAGRSIGHAPKSRMDVLIRAESRSARWDQPRTVATIPAR
ncbi:hypothetical protein ABZ894_24220 [Nocardia beijingensis]|uniref:hypothetical protein n=1 Tax=Nocardia beijingensis TaxID=95162 RepID=UPI0033EEA6FC